MKIKQNLRIIWAITAKDINDAVKNKILQGVFIGVVLMMLSSQALSLLVLLRAEPSAFFWDRGKSVKIKEIVRNRELHFYPQDSLTELQRKVSQSVEPVLGFVIPVDFDDRIEAGEAIELQVYYLHLLSPDKTADLVSYFEDRLSQLIGVAIRLNIEENNLYPPSEGVGYPMMIAIGAVLGVMTVGLILTPYLFIDEKETHTLEALLISPARTSHILIGKSLTGIFYSLITSTVILVFSWRWIVHWDLVLLSVILGGISAVSIGLLIGVLFNTPTTVNMLNGLLIAILLLPMYFWNSLVARWSPFLQTILAALPSMAMYRIVRQSFSYISDPTAVLSNIAVLVGWIIVFLTLIAWRIRRLDR